MTHKLLYTRCAICDFLQDTSGEHRHFVWDNATSEWHCDECRTSISGDLADTTVDQTYAYWLTDEEKDEVEDIIFFNTFAPLASEEAPTEAKEGPPISEAPTPQEEAETSVDPLPGDLNTYPDREGR